MLFVYGFEVRPRLLLPCDRRSAIFGITYVSTASIKPPSSAQCLPRPHSAPTFVVRRMTQASWSKCYLLLIFFPTPALFRHPITRDAVEKEVEFSKVFTFSIQNLRSERNQVSE